jgi:16S rRNA (uracil1498-N3)-methyltransferase
VIIDGEEGRHAATVKRIEVGEQLSVGDGRGTVLTCVTTAVAKDRIEARILARTVAAASSPRIVVVQALPKGDRGELAVELLTELGADEIVPWSAARSIAQWRDARGEKALERWRRTAREAAKQSRRPFVPPISELATTKSVVERISGTKSLVLHQQAALPLVEVELVNAGIVHLIVGPEGGVCDEELAAFSAAGAVAVRLGEPILRTSTAGAAALAALSVRTGRWS